MKRLVHTRDAAPQPVLVVVMESVKGGEEVNAVVVRDALGRCISGGYVRVRVIAHRDLVSGEHVEIVE